MNEFIDECRVEWRRLGVPDPIANEMAADPAADIEEAESEGDSAEDVLGNGRVRPQALCRIVGGGPWGHGAPSSTNAYVCRPALARAGLWPDGIGGTPCPDCCRDGGWSPECLSGIGSPVRGRATLDPRLPRVSRRAAAFPTFSRGRTLRNPPACPWRRRDRPLRLFWVSLERWADRAMGDSPIPS